MISTIYIPTTRYHWLRQKISKDWLTVVKTIYKNVLDYLNDHPMPDFPEVWSGLNMSPRHHTLNLPQEIVDYFTQLGKGDFKLGFFIAIEVYVFSVDPDRAVTSWAIWKAFRDKEAVP